MRSFKHLERCSRHIFRKLPRSVLGASIKSNVPLTPMIRCDAFLDQRRDFFWFNSTNPILELAKKNESNVDLSSITPKQLMKASSQICTEYKQLLPSLKYDKFNSLTALIDFVESEIEALDSASKSILGIADLMFNVNLMNSSWSKAYRQVYLEQNDTFRHKKRTVATAAQRYLASTPEGANELAQLHQLLALSAERGAEITEEDMMNALNGGEQEGGGNISELDVSSGSQNEEGEQDLLATLKRIETEGGEHIVDRDALNALNNAEDQVVDIFAPVGGILKAKGSTREKLQNIYSYIAIKQKQAELLGFDNHVDRAFHRRMLPRDGVEALLEEVSERAQNAMNFSVASSKQEDDLTLSDYITLDGTLQGLFALSRAMFGIIIAEDNKPKGWHMDVRLFHVTNEKDEKLGSFYLDPYERIEKKRGAFMGPLGSGIVYLCANIKPPLWDHLPKKIEFRDVISIFHEFGHVLQYLMADADKGKRLGSTYASKEIVEIVPQFMEHWVLIDSVLQTLAHLSSGTKIPVELIRKVQDDHRRTKLDETLGSAFFGHLELAMFSNQNEGESLVAMQRRLADRFVPHHMRQDSDLSPLTTLIEYNADGHSVAAYRYLMADVISADIFHAFHEANISNEEEMRRLGGVFADVVLKPGFDVDVKQVLQAFCGRDSISTEAFYGMLKL